MDSVSKISRRDHQVCLNKLLSNPKVFKSTVVSMGTLQKL